MKKFIFGLLIGLIVGVGVMWQYGDGRRQPVDADAKDSREAVHDKMNSLDLRVEDIKEELARTGKVIRQKAREAGNAIADATADARITAAIKGKLLTDPDLSVLSISVNTTAGRVTMSGTASSPENIRKAMQIALDTPGVLEVVSTLQVK